MMILYNAIKHKLASPRWTPWVLILLFVLPVFGCAQTITDKDIKGEEVEFIINFGAAVDTTTYRYYVIISGTGSPAIDTVTDNFFFFAPGQFLLANEIPLIENQDSDGILFYYTNYFSTWADFIQLDTTGVNLFNGPFTMTTTTLDAQIEEQQNFTETPGFNTFSGSSAQIKLRFPLSFTSIGSATNMYFQFLVVGANGDILDSITDGEFIKIEDVINVERTDSDASTPAAPANITEWEVQIF